MANLGDTYDATGGETMREGGAIAPGWYTACIAKSDKEDAKSGGGNAYIAFEFEVTEGDSKGRRFWLNLNLWNTSSQAVEIAQRELNTIMHACGKLRISDTEELHGIPMQVKLGYEKGNKDRNKPNAYKPLNAAPATQQSQQQQGDAQSGPWKSGQAA